MLVLGTLRSMKQTQSLSSQSFGLCQEFLVILRAPSIYGQLQCLPDLWLLIYTSLLNIYTWLSMMHLKLNMYKATPGFRYPHMPKPILSQCSLPLKWQYHSPKYLNTQAPNTWSIFDSFPLLIASSYSQRKLCWLHPQKNILSPVASYSPPRSQHRPGYPLTLLDA